MHVSNTQEVKLPIVEKRPHWFLDRLRLFDLITVVFVTLVVFCGIYFRLGILLPTMLLIVWSGAYFYLIRYSKNYAVVGELILDKNELRVNNQIYSWQSIDKAELTYKAYKNYVEWNYKQVAINQLSLQVGQKKNTYRVLLKVSDLEILTSALTNEKLSLHNVRDKK